MQRALMLSRAFLNAYPVLGLNLGAKERDSLIRHLPLEFKAAFVFEHYMKQLNLDWTFLEPVAQISEGDTWIKIDDTRPPRTTSHVFEIRIHEPWTDNVDVEHLGFVVHEIGFNGRPKPKILDAGGWLKRIEKLHHFLSIECEIGKIFVRFEWIRLGNDDWKSPICDMFCQRFGPRWQFWDGSHPCTEFGYDTAEEISYWSWHRQDHYFPHFVPRNETVLSRNEWLKAFSESVASLTASPFIKRDASPKRKRNKNSDKPSEQ